MFSLTVHHAATEHVGSWSPADIAEVAALVEAEDITRVDRLGLAGFQYSEKDIKNVLKILPVTQLMGVYLPCLPHTMGLKHWRALGSACHNLEKVKYWSDCVRQGCESEAGKVLPMVRRAEIRDVEFHNFDGFQQAMVEELQKEESRCEELMFCGWTVEKHKAGLMKLGESLGWKTSLQSDDQIILKK